MWVKYIKCSLWVGNSSRKYSVNDIIANLTSLAMLGVKAFVSLGTPSHYVVLLRNGDKGKCERAARTSAHDGHQMSHQIDRLMAGWPDFISWQGPASFCFDTAAGHLNSCAVGTRGDAARLFYCWNISCMEFALCDFTTWHLGTEETFPFILLVQVLRPVCWFTSDSVEFFCYVPHPESLGGSSLI